MLFRLTTYGVVAIVAVVALAQINRLTISGFLQGMLWPGVSSVVAIIVLIVQAHSFLQGQTLAAWIIEAVSLALGVIGAILLMISWSPATERRPARQIRGFRLMLLVVAGLSQVPALVFYVRIGDALNLYYYYALGSLGILVALAVTWYAMSLQPRTLGGALVLGWATVAAMLLTIETTYNGPYLSGLIVFCVILGYVLLAAVIVFAIIYVRKPSELEASPD